MLSSYKLAVSETTGQYDCTKKDCRFWTNCTGAASVVYGDVQNQQLHRRPTDGANKTMYTRIVGALFYPGGVYAAYNIRNSTNRLRKRFTVKHDGRYGNVIHGVAILGLGNIYPISPLCPFWILGEIGYIVERVPTKLERRGKIFFFPQVRFSDKPEFVSIALSDYNRHK
jgi:hypothetical protein